MFDNASSGAYGEPRQALQGKAPRRDGGSGVAMSLTIPFWRW